MKYLRIYAYYELENFICIKLFNDCNSTQNQLSKNNKNSMCQQIKSIAKVRNQTCNNRVNNCTIT